MEDSDVGLVVWGIGSLSRARADGLQWGDGVFLVWELDGDSFLRGRYVTATAHNVLYIGVESVLLSRVSSTSR